MGKFKRQRYYIHVMLLCTRVSCRAVFFVILVTTEKVYNFRLMICFAKQFDIFIGNSGFFLVIIVISCLISSISLVQESIVASIYWPPMAPTKSVCRSRDDKTELLVTLVATRATFLKCAFEMAEREFIFP